MKKDYIEMRNRKIIDPWVLYTFVREQGATMSIQEFQFAAPFLDYHTIIDHIDRFFGLVRLYDKND